MIQPSFREQWDEFLLKTGKYFNVLPNDEFLLFMIGIQESGKGFDSFSKQEKTDLISLGICKVLELGGYMQQSGHDSEGWPLFISIKPHQPMPPMQYQKLMRQGIMDYFQINVFSQQ